MRGLISGFIGAAASVAAWLGAEHFQQANYGWMVCLVGLVTGVAVNKGSDITSTGFARGALALILSLASIVGGPMVYAKIMQANAIAEKSVIKMDKTANEEDTSETEDEETESTEAVSTALDAKELDTDPTLGKSNYSKSAMRKNMSDWDMIWMCVAGLAAYLTGKGGEKAQPIDESSEEPHTDTPADSEPSEE